jgi:hypothetical protein
MNKDVKTIILKRTITLLNLKEQRNAINRAIRDENNAIKDIIESGVK